MRDEITMPEAPAGFPLAVSPEEIPYETAYRAYTWNSMSPERRARQEQADYLGELYSIWTSFLPMATTDEKRAQLAAHVERYRERLRRHWLVLLAARSRVANPMVTGPAKFPTRRNEKALNSEDRRREEYLEWRKRARHAIARDLAPPPPTPAEELRKLEAQRDRMKAINAEYRKRKGDIDAMALPADVLTDRLRETIKGAKAAHSYSWPFVPFEGFQLTSVNGKIKRLQESIAREAKRSAVAEALKNETPREVLAGDVRIVDNVAEDRVQLFYPSKPDEATRARLKSNGFRWAPSSGAWQAYRTGHTVFRIRQLFGVDVQLA